MKVCEGVRETAASPRQPGGFRTLGTDEPAAFRLPRVLPGRPSRGRLSKRHLHQTPCEYAEQQTTANQKTVTLSAGRLLENLRSISCEDCMTSNFLVAFTDKEMCPIGTFF